MLNIRVKSPAEKKLYYVGTSEVKNILPTHKKLMKVMFGAAVEEKYPKFWFPITLLAEEYK